MERYDSYKDSGVEWIGEIPSGWNFLRGRFLFSNKKEINKENIETNLLSLTLNGVLNKNINSNEGLRPSDYETYQIFERNDLVFKLIDLENTQTSRVGLVHERGLMSPVYIRLESKERILSKFSFYFYYDLYKRHIFNFLGSGVRSSLTPSNLLEIEIPLPPLSEQSQIVQFLDEKTSLIDSLIEKTKRKIELLKEERTSLINHTVTKGLNPNVELKDSGVEWIGEIPSHWGITKPKYEFNISGGGTPSKEKSEFWDGDIPWVSPKDMKSKFISKTEDYVTILGVQNSSTKLIRETSLLMVVRSGILQHTIPVCFNSIPVTVNQDLKSFEEKKEMTIYYLYYFIKGHERNLLLVWSKDGTTVESIEMDFMMNSDLPIPPLSEQEEIVSFLDEKTSTIDKTIELEGKRIEYLKEYRQSLISEVVTGKIKVITDE